MSLKTIKRIDDMIVTVKKYEEVEVKYVYVDLGVRYLEDGDINGNEAEADGSDTPFYNKEDKRVKFTIDVDEGKILDYPIGTEWKLYYKVCDDGNYELMDENYNMIDKLEGEYVPTFLAINECGYGDYVIMKVDKNGYIQDWNPHFEDNFENIID